MITAPLDTYGDNFPVAKGFPWDPRTPWRHGHAMPGAGARHWSQVGWWTLVVVLMGLLLLVAVRDGFSAEPSAPNELIVTFKEGAIRYPDGAAIALLHRVQFQPPSLQRLNARFGLVAVARVVSPAAPTARTFRLRFASRTGLTRAVAAYQRDPSVQAVALGPVEPRSPSASPRPSAVRTLDA